LHLRLNVIVASIWSTECSWLLRRSRRASSRRFLF